MSLKFKVTLLGSRGVGKTSLAHFAVNSGPRTGGYEPTTDDPEANKFLFQLDHPLGKCLLDIEDTPGYKPDPRNEREEKSPPVELFAPPIAYLFCDDGVRKPGASEPEEPEDPEGEEDEEPPTETTELVAPGAVEDAGVSALDALAQLDRQGFVVVYNSMDRDSFKEAEKILLELQDRMTKPEEVTHGDEPPPAPDEEPPPAIPCMPIVLVAAHADAKKKSKKKLNKKHIVGKEEGADLADGMAIPFFETNAMKGGKHVQDVFVAVVSAIQKIEDNLIWDQPPTMCDKFCNQCCPGWCSSCSLNKCCCGLCEGPITCCGCTCCASNPLDGCALM